VFQKRSGGFGEDRKWLNPDGFEPHIVDDTLCITFYNYPNDVS